MTASAFVSFTVKVAIPLELVVPLTGDMVECPIPCARVMALLLTGLLFASSRVTVMVEVVVPSAVTEAGFALTVDVPALTEPGFTV